MKGRITSALLAFVLLFGGARYTAQAAEKPAPAFTPIKGWDMMKTLKAGINIGNSLDARQGPEETWADGLDFEMIWNEPKITPELFKAIAEKGFNFVRIPASWGPHVDADYTISEERMNRVQEVVDWALDAGLYAQLNTHHEYELYGMMQDNDYEEAKRYLTALWTQIGGRFKDYPERLFFGVMNEPQRTDAWPLEDNQALYKDFHPITNKLNADGLAAIRESGGYNDKRVVVLFPVGAGACDPFNAKHYVHPKNDEYLMVEAHGSGHWAFASPDAGEWDTDKFTDTKSVDDIFKQLDKSFLSKGIPIYIGETGVVYKNNQAERVKWTKYFYGKAAGMGLPVAWWNVGETDAIGHQPLIDRVHLTWPHPEIVNAILAAYKVKPGPDYTGAVPSMYPHELRFNTHPDDPMWAAHYPALARNAKALVVEYAGGLGWYNVYAPGEGTEWFKVDETRHRKEDGKLTVNLAGLDYKIVDVIFQLAPEDVSKVTRIYLSE